MPTILALLEAAFLVTASRDRWGILEVNPVRRQLEFQRMAAGMDADTCTPMEYIAECKAKPISTGIC